MPQTLIVIFHKQIAFQVTDISLYWILLARPICLFFSISLKNKLEASWLRSEHVFKGAPWLSLGYFVQYVEQNKLQLY